MAIFEELKSVAATLQEAGKIEQYKQIVQAQKELLEMQKQISELEKDKKELEEKLRIKDSLIFENNAYWINKSEKKDGPFCSCCWDDNRKIIRMQTCGNPAYFDCPKCGNKGVQIYPDKNRDYSANSEPFDPYSVI